MNKMTEPAIEDQKVTSEEAMYFDARTQQGLADIEAGRILSVEEARSRMNTRIAAARQKNSRP